VIKRRQNVCFALEPSQSFLVLREVVGENLDGNVTAQLSVGGTVDDAHSTSTDLLDQLVVQQRLSRCKAHGAAPLAGDHLRDVGLGCRRRISRPQGA
jgi:hypothetical protein